MKTYQAHSDYKAVNNSIIDVLRLSDFVDEAKYRVNNACINVGGWQSWNDYISLGVCGLLHGNAGTSCNLLFESV